MKFLLKFEPSVTGQIYLNQLSRLNDAFQQKITYLVNQSVISLSDSTCLQVANTTHQMDYLDSSIRDYHLFRFMQDSLSGSPVPTGYRKVSEKFKSRVE